MSTPSPPLLPSCAPSRHSRDVRVYGHTTTDMHKLSTPPLPPSFPPSSLSFSPHPPPSRCSPLPPSVPPCFRPLHTPRTQNHIQDRTFNTAHIASQCSTFSPIQTASNTQHRTYNTHIIAHTAHTAPHIQQRSCRIAQNAHRPRTPA